MDNYDKLMQELQARCSKCDKTIHSVDSAKVLLDKDDKRVIICNECAEKYKEDYKPCLKGLNENDWFGL